MEARGEGRGQAGGDVRGAPVQGHAPFAGPGGVGAGRGGFEDGGRDGVFFEALGEEEAGCTLVAVSWYVCMFVCVCV